MGLVFGVLLYSVFCILDWVVVVDTKWIESCPRESGTLWA